MVAFQEQLYFVATAQADEQQLALWRTDGQAVVEVKVLPFDHSNSLHFAVVGEQLFFNALTAEQDGTALWRSDGTTDGTVLVAPVQLALCRENQRFVADQTHVFFCAADAEHGAELWKSDGTENGTMLVKDLVAGPQGAYPTPLLLFGDRLYLQTADGATSSALWQSDGTANGTQLFAEQFVTDRHSGAAITEWREQLYFMAGPASDATQAALWRSDGTISGTTLAAHLPYRAASAPLLSATPTALFFIGYTPATSEELWALDTTLDQQIFLPLLRR
jgi:ELWxxDGT repeat protein